MTLWEQYNPEHSLGSVLAEETKLPLASRTDKELYEVLKRHLTRRELRCFVLSEAGMAETEIAVQTGFEPEDVLQALQKGRKKLRQPKLQQAFSALIHLAETSQDDAE